MVWALGKPKRSGRLRQDRRRRCWPGGSTAGQAGIDEADDALDEAADGIEHVDAGVPDRAVKVST